MPDPMTPTPRSRPRRTVARSGAAADQDPPAQPYRDPVVPPQPGPGESPVRDPQPPPYQDPPQRM